MNPLDRTLIKKLALVLVLKLVILTVLYWVFVRGHQTNVDGDSVAAQFLHNALNSVNGVSP
ncbi:cytochrome oxidase putative small subunit CydP [Rhodoferax sp. UBA5149]|uniref:cytochrome oxidase putative small subunit CydP n=1 Tax=Rhodoferax sp. UBA5149 TaxID=1947379 RepID=UPI0039C9E3C8